MQSLKLWQPRFIEDSQVPVWLSKLAPIEIQAISLAFWVFSRDKLSQRTRRHETIHFQQWIELGVLGFLLLYPVFYLYGLLKYRDKVRAYRAIPFEREAYENDGDSEYLRTRRRMAWIGYLSSGQ